MAKLQSNHKFYESDINPDIKLQDYNTHLVQTQNETLGEATHSYSSFTFWKIYLSQHAYSCYNRFKSPHPWAW